MKQINQIQLSEQCCQEHLCQPRRRPPTALDSQPSHYDTAALRTEPTQLPRICSQVPIFSEVIARKVKLVALRLILSEAAVVHKHEHEDLLVGAHTV